MSKHISYSELKTWAECPRKHKISYIDRIRRFIGNEYTAFGRSIHALCENAVQGTLDERDYDDFFDEYFDRELGQLGEGHERKNDLITGMREQAKIISPLILPKLKEHFGGYEVFSVEEKLFVKINDFLLDKYDFKGYIDLVIKTSDGKVMFLGLGC